MIDSDAGYLIGGKGLNSSFLLKVSPMGNFVWAHSFPEAAAIETMMKNGQSTVIAGKKTGTSAGVYVARVNNIDGNIIWGKTISGQVMVPKDVAPAGNNAFVLLAEKPGITYGIGDECYLIKFDEEGTLLWKKSFANGKDLSPQCMQLTSDSGYIIGGTMLMKLDSEGTIQWLRQWYYGNQIRDIFQTDNSGFVAACGDAWSNYSNISAYKFSPSGTIEWKSVLGNEEDFPQTILQTADKGIVIGGGRGSYGLYLLKTDSLGQSGCNTDFGTIPYYQDNFSFCVVNEPSITIAASNDAENLSSFDVISFPVNAMDPCCNATAEIDGSYYPCAGDSFYFYGYGSTHLLWSNGDTTRNIITTDTIVFLTVTNTCGSFTDSMIIHPAFTPTFTYSVSKDTICRSDSVMLAFYGNAPVYYCYANNDMYLLKTDSLGNLSWAKNYFSSGNEEGTRGLETADGGFLAVGNNYDLDVGDRIFLLKTDHQGNIHWSRKIETLSYSVRVTAENAPGQRFLINASSYAKGYLMMFDDAGEAVWSKKIEYPNSVWSSNLYITNDNAIVCMTYAFFGKHVLAKIDWTGNPIWSRAINIQGYSTNATLMQLQDGTFLISGSENTIGYYGSDQISLINTDEYGETNCSDTANPVVSDVSVNFLNHSTSVGSLGREIDFNFNEYPNLFQTLTICHSAEEISIVQEMPQQSFIKIFPNPGRGVFNLETRLPEIDYQINIYDFTGRCIVQQKVRRSKCTIDLGWASKGVYFLEFVSNEMREVKKIVLN